MAGASRSDSATGQGRLNAGRRERASLTLDEGVAESIYIEARWRRMTRTAYVEWMVRRIAQTGG